MYPIRKWSCQNGLKGPKPGVGIKKCHKKSFYGQEMLLLLGQLAYNLTARAHKGLASSQARLQQLGMLRMVRGAFYIAGNPCSFLRS